MTGSMSRTTPLSELRAEADHAARRLALYRRRVYLGRADPAGVAEYERAAQGAAKRLRAAEHARAEPPPRSTTP